jgi:hypothetical protein
MKELSYIVFPPLSFPHTQSFSIYFLACLEALFICLKIEFVSKEHSRVFLFCIRHYANKKNMSRVAMLFVRASA